MRLEYLQNSLGRWRTEEVWSKPETFHGVRNVLREYWTEVVIGNRAILQTKNYLELNVWGRRRQNCNDQIHDHSPSVLSPIPVQWQLLWPTTWQPLIYLRAWAFSGPYILVRIGELKSIIYIFHSCEDQIGEWLWKCFEGVKRMVCDVVCASHGASQHTFAHRLAAAVILSSCQILSFSFITPLLVMYCIFWYQALDIKKGCNKYGLEKFTVQHNKISINNIELASQIHEFSSKDSTDHGSKIFGKNMCLY